MSRYLIGLMAVVALLSLAACGKSPGALTDSQKTEFGTFMDSTGRAQKAVNAASPNPQTMAVAPTLENGDNGQNLMSDKLQHNCGVNVEGGEAGFSMKADGAGCPVAMDMKMSMKNSQSGTEVSAEINYSVKNPEYAKLNDVDSISMKQTMSIKGGESTTGKFEMSGKIHSQSKGDVKLSGNGSLDANKSSIKSDVTLRFEFSDYTVEFKVAQKDQDMTYTLNGDKISEKDFNEYFRRGGKAFETETMLSAKATAQ